MMKSGIQDAYGIGIFIAALAATYFELIPTVLIVVIAGTLGVLIKNIIKSKRRNQMPDFGLLLTLFLNFSKPDYLHLAEAWLLFLFFMK